MGTKPPGVRKIVDLSAFTDGPYMLCILGCLLGYTGCYTAFYYISFYGEAKGWMSTSLSLYLVPILNAASAFERVLPNWLSDKIDPINVLIPGILLPTSNKHSLTFHQGAFMTGVLLLCNLAVHNAAGIICTAAFLSYFSGVFIATPLLVFINLTKDKSKLGTRLGMAFAIMGLGVLSGGPGSGAILQRDPNQLDWKATWTFGGVFAIGAGVVFCVLRAWLGGLELRVKV